MTLRLRRSHNLFMSESALGSKVTLSYYGTSNQCLGEPADVVVYSLDTCISRNPYVNDKVSIVASSLTYVPSQMPTMAPTMTPTISFTPTMAPTMTPTAPTSAPTMTPTAPTSAPTMTPTASPTEIPTMTPTAPTMTPTMTPTASPTETPTMTPTASPTVSPTMTPTASPTATPTTASPTALPTATPTTGSPTPIPKFTTKTRRACFAASETVTFESGELKAISNVKVGDRVLAASASGHAVFSEVIFVPHSANTEIALFTQISTVDGRDIKMTQNHLLPAGACKSSTSMPLIYASQVSVGDCIQTVSGEQKVSKVALVRGEGVYTIVTKEEYIVVNGIIASPFGINHMMANLYYNIHRIAYVSAPLLISSPIIRSLNEVNTCLSFHVFSILSYL